MYHTKHRIIHNNNNKKEKKTRTAKTKSFHFCQHQKLLTLTSWAFGLLCARVSVQLEFFVPEYFSPSVLLRFYFISLASLWQIIV